MTHDMLNKVVVGVAIVVVHVCMAIQLEKEVVFEVVVVYQHM